ncbi:tRNA preQ1(34) S-adenosylmethionine ribosyltransferase-isomerase QueA [Oceanidesulfovibrio marinus]|uniref:S-adenosylmethionine:tRNA ribosyltransferase-isomerase n=1 Tax=Oceanidesulfovibrio marinus TaxID=370038 RepID=A0A6P1ZJU4_9BACT|nr:tRNA preQ1(34) S-adenosylmethionine ribosyltransferase-isomerase QueA [Oceanidesulfovibrio marinus]TVM35862.1 tRNA preQ1(34) S-adenosylmethionine ribosyltransferase-isomerase QueA [Oceanidesulfovibrio marinus]
MNEFDLDAYDFELPQECIATHPTAERSASRLLVVDRASKVLTDEQTKDVASLLPKGALLVVNDTRVVPARLHGRRDTGGKVEFLLLTPIPCMDVRAIHDGWSAADVEGLVKSSKGPKPGERIPLGTGVAMVMGEKGEFGRSHVTMEWRGDLAARLEENGEMPLPPYLGRAPEDSDSRRYQTEFARAEKAGSVAAPTAGLHFDAGIRASLEDAGIEIATVSLYVGYGTFSPVRAQDIREHVMHAEFAELTAETAEQIRRAKEQGRPVIPVGTTSLRTLEGAYAATGDIVPFRGWIDIFIKPPYTPMVADGLFTNFHLPKSSLFILVSALAGREFMQRAYAHARDSGYRFFSYGDAMLIL